MIKEVEKDFEKLAKKCKQYGIVLLSKSYHGRIVTVEADHYQEVEDDTT